MSAVPKFLYKPGQLPSQQAVRSQPAVAVAGETPDEFGNRMAKEGTKTYDDVLKLITHLSTRVPASELTRLNDLKKSLVGAKEEFDDKTITQTVFDEDVQRIYQLLRKYRPYFAPGIKAGRRRKTKRSKRSRRKTAKK